jgi:predicted permease
MVQRLLAGATPLALFILGYLLKRNNFFKDSTIDDIKKFVLNIALPAMLFHSFMTVHIQKEQLVIPLVLFIYCTITLYLGDLIAKIFKIENPYFTLLMCGFEMGMYGYAIFMALYGQEYLAVISFLALGHILFIFTLFMARLMGIKDGQQSLGLAIKRIIASPVIIAIVSGIVIGNLPFNFPQNPLLTTLNSIIRLVGSVTVPLITITIGYGIHIDKGNLGFSLFTIFIRKIFMVIFALLVNYFIIDKLLHLPSIYRYAMLSMALTPATFLVSVYVRPNDEVSSRYVNSTISLDCLLSLFIMVAASIIYV